LSTHTPESLQALAARVSSLMPLEGCVQSSRLDARLLRVEQARPAQATLQEPALVFMLSGRKRGRIAGKAFEYQAGQCLVLGLPLLFSCETPALDNEVTLALVLPIDSTAIRLLLNESPTPPRPEASAQIASVAMSVSRLGDASVGLLHRLLDVMQGKHNDMPALQSQDNLYRALLESELKHALWVAANGSQAMQKVHDAIQLMQKLHASELDVKTLASRVHLSESAFHKAFKSLTGQTPMRYLKQYRLHLARRLIQQHDRHIAQVAFAVGYQSPTQFSRDFKQHFGHTAGDTRKQPPAADPI